MPAMRNLLAFICTKKAGNRISDISKTVRNPAHKAAGDLPVGTSCMYEPLKHIPGKFV